MKAVLSGPIIPTAFADGLAKKGTPAKIRQAATDFEALLLAQMLTSAREASAKRSDRGGDDSDANSTMIELWEQQLAQALASSGGFGMAKILATGLAKNADR
jgi:Rod binding domain-containing protein